MVLERAVKAVLFDMDGTLLDTESLSDKAVLLAFGSSLPEAILNQEPMKDYRLPWEAKKQILGLRGAEWTPIILNYAKEHWGVTEEMSLPTPYVKAGLFCFFWGGETIRQSERLMMKIQLFLLFL